MQFSRVAPNIYFKILRPSKFTSTLRTIAADIDRMQLQALRTLCMSAMRANKFRYTAVRTSIIR